jgi:hypothetical protein
MLLLPSIPLAAQAPMAASMPVILADSLAAMDSILFAAALSTCRIGEADSMLAPDFVFLQDEGGRRFTTQIPRRAFLDGSAEYCARNVQSSNRRRRVVVTGTMQAYFLDGYGAIQMGLQQFFDATPGQSDRLAEVSRFVNTWTNRGGRWRLTRQFISQERIAATPMDAMVFDTIARLDSVLFAAMNNRDLSTLAAMYDDGLEFYHDRSGVLNYEANLRISRENFARSAESVRRELDVGSLEVYPVKGFGAIEVGAHKFFTRVAGQPERLASAPRFVLIWRNENGRWRVVRAISYGH